VFDFEVRDEGMAVGLARVAEGLRSPLPLMRDIAGFLKKETDENFAAQGRPAWLGLSPRTLKRRGADAKILQDTGRLAGSIATSYDRTHATVGTNVRYAAIHQLGGTIQRAAYSKQVRHRTNAKGELMRTDGFNGKGLVFAKGRHKRALTRWFEVPAHAISIPARPYLPFTSGGVLQPSTRSGVMTLTNDYLASLVGPRRQFAK